MPNGSLLLTVADGVSSARYGGEGALLAVQAVTRSAAEHRYDDADLRQYILDARDTLLRHAGAIGRPASDFATTLIVATISPEGVVSAAQIGDGAVIVLDEDGILQRVIQEDASVAYANTVNPLTVESAVEYIRTGTAANAISVAVISDGLEPLAMDASQPFAGFWLPMFRFAAQGGPTSTSQLALESWLKGEGVQQATDDDCTIVIAQQEARHQGQRKGEVLCPK